MTDQATLRRYHAALSEATTERKVMHASRRFRAAHGMDAHTNATLAIRTAHLDRTAGRGSPADCDTALNEALRSIGA